MNINRHNYEEFFLLYIDNELSEEQRMEVEEFITQHPDLKAELEILSTTLINEEAILFPAKDLLFRSEANDINASNYEEHFLLYVDNELNKEEREAVEKYVLQNPKLQDEFLLLQQTRLPHEEIIFSNKDTLYRHEKERRVIPIMWMRMSVAAAVIGLIATLWFALPSEKAVDPITTAAVTESGVKPQLPAVC